MVKISLAIVTSLMRYGEFLRRQTYGKNIKGAFIEARGFFRESHRESLSIGKKSPVAALKGFVINHLSNGYYNINWAGLTKIRPLLPTGHNTKPLPV